MSQPDESDRAWATYATARLLALAPPFDDIERAAAARAEILLQRCFGFDSATAANHAHRCLLFRREHLLHESLLLDMPVPQVVPIIDAVVVDGLDQLRLVDRNRGLLLVSLHYSLYSSILVLWLARAATRGLINHLTVFMRSGYIGYGVVAEHRWQQAEQCGLLSREHFALADRTERGPSAAVRTLVAKLRRGDVVLVFPDATFIPRRDKSLELCVGGQTVSLPRGAAWLVREAECPVLPIYVRPENADRHAIVFGAPQDPVAGRDPAAAVQASLQYIVSHALMRDPGPWEGWLREWSTP